MKSARILVVDDDQDILEMTDCYFSKAGMEVHCAGSGEEALGKIQDIIFSIVITDYNMPGMNGLELARKIREISPPTPIIMTTGQPSKVPSELATQMGVSLVLAKPVHPDKLLSLIDEVIEFTSS